MVNVTIQPGVDLIGVLDVSTGLHLEGSVGSVVKAALAQGTGISLAFDSGTGLTTIATSYLNSNFVVPYAIATGTTALAATFSAGFVSLVTGLVVTISLSNPISGATTFNANGSGAIAIRGYGNAALVSGQAAAGDVLVLEYDGTYWRAIGGLSQPLLEGPTGPAGPAGPTGPQGPGPTLPTAGTRWPVGAYWAPGYKHTQVLFEGGAGGTSVYPTYVSIGVNGSSEPIVSGIFNADYGQWDYSDAAFTQATAASHVGYGGVYPPAAGTWLPVGGNLNLVFGEGGPASLFVRIA